MDQPPEDKEGVYQGSHCAHLWRGLNSPAPAILQGSHPLEHIIPSECLETRWSSGGHKKAAIRQCVGLDGARVHHGVH